MKPARRVYIPVPEKPFDAEKLRKKGEKVHSLLTGYLRSSKRDPSTDEFQRDRLKAIQQQLRWELDRRFPPPGTPTGSLINLWEDCDETRQAFAGGSPAQAR